MNKNDLTDLLKALLRSLMILLGELVAKLAGRFEWVDDLLKNFQDGVAGIALKNSLNV